MYMYMYFGYGQPQHVRSSSGGLRVAHTLLALYIPMHPFWH